MLIPIRDENPTSRTAWVTLAIIALNVLAFLIWEPTFASGRIGEARQQLFFFCHAEIPWEVTHQTSLAEGGAAAQAAIDEEIPDQGAALQAVLKQECPHKSWWQSVFVAMFLHGGWLHIGGNMLFLWVFGNNVEDKIGPFAYILFYLIAGIAAAVLQTVSSPDSVIPSLGASGAIAGVLGAYLVMFPRARVLSIVPIFFIFTLIPLPAVVLLGFWFLLQFFSGATTLAQHVTGGVAYFAHVGGFVLGVVAALLFFPKDWSLGMSRPPPPPPPAW